MKRSRRETSRESKAKRSKTETKLEEFDTKNVREVEGDAVVVSKDHFKKLESSHCMLKSIVEVICGSKKCCRYPHTSKQCVIENVPFGSNHFDVSCACDLVLLLGFFKDGNAAFCVTKKIAMPEIKAAQDIKTMDLAFSSGVKFDTLSNFHLELDSFSVNCGTTTNGAMPRNVRDLQIKGVVYSSNKKGSVPPVDETYVHVKSLSIENIAGVKQLTLPPNVEDATFAYSWELTVRFPATPNPLLTKLVVDRCSGIEFVDLKVQAPSLTHLDVTGSFVAVPPWLVRNLPSSLQELNLSMCVLNRDEAVALRTFLTETRVLRSLNVGQTSMKPDASAEVMHGVGECVSLRSLDIYNTVVHPALLVSMNRLKHLSVRRCNINNDKAVEFAQVVQRSNLTSIDVSGNFGAMHSVLLDMMLANNRKLLDIKHFSLRDSHRVQLAANGLHKACGDDLHTIFHIRGLTELICEYTLDECFQSIM